MKLEKGMIIRNIDKIGKHKKGNIYKVTMVSGNLVFAEEINGNEKLVLYKYSELVELIETEIFHVWSRGYNRAKAKYIHV